MLTGELDGKARLADEVVTVKLQRENVEGAVGVLRKQRAAPFFQKDPTLHWAVPHLQDVMVYLRVKDNEVETAGKHTRSNSYMSRVPNVVDY